MGAIDKDHHRPWLAYALEESLEQSLLAPKDVIGHANPEVLVTQLPPSVISVLLSRALAIGTFSAAQVLESAPPALLAEHLDPEVMWRCLQDAADRGGLSKKGGSRSGPSRQWFASVLARALESELITPSDVLRFLPPSDFATEAPRPVLVDLIKEALSRSTFDAELVLQHITPIVIAENLETSQVWECIAEAAGRHFELGATAAKPGESTPAKTTATAPAPASVAVATVKPTANPPEKERPTPSTNGERRAPGPVDKTPAAAKPLERPALERRAPSPADKAPVAVSVGGTNTPAAKPLSSAPTAPRAEITLQRAPASVPVAVPGSPTARHDASEWTLADDVLEDDSLPFPAPR